MSKKPKAPLSSGVHARGGTGGGVVVVLDRPVALALVALALVYSLITVVTYQHVAASDHATMATATATTMTTNDNTGNDADAAAGALDSVHALQHAFPLHVTDDTRETIEHPGLPYINNKQGARFPHDLNARRLRVPQFFDRAYGRVYGHGGKRRETTIREYLGQHGRRLITRDEASSIGSFDAAGRETIYCSVASYRDPECAGTVTDVFERAEYPERVRVAVVEQRSDGDAVCTTPSTGRSCADDPAQTLCRYGHLIDYFEMDARFGVGPVFARHLAHRHYRGEYYAMQIDSHVRFTEHWDTDIVGQWKSAKNESACLNGGGWLMYEGHNQSPGCVRFWVCTRLTLTQLCRNSIFTVAILTAYPSDISGAIDPVTHESKHPSTYGSAR